ncbi:DUF4870 domain-containing protein [Cytobacillus sp. FJAT-54145]|uniref:DUF4870 domain-containing protein n=1 Tax=Cytobacillus spartinae TaxID=3299023 RepID=A0ABW6KBI1_9BACI
METRKVLAAISYFSVLFAGIIVPLIIMLVAEDQEVRDHSKKALLSHLIPLIPVPIILISAFVHFDSNQNTFPIFFFFGVGATVILSLIVLIWNIVKGIKVLSER